MSSKYNNLEELRRKKELLKKEVSEMEHLLKFENKKESLSAITHGFTDRFLEEKVDTDGEKKLSIKTGEIVKEVGQKLTAKTENNSVIQFNNDGLKENAVENVLRLGSVALAGGIAKKKLSKPGWKNKLIGLAMVYLLPVALKFISRKLEEYQKQKSVSSMEKLI